MSALYFLKGEAARVHGGPYIEMNKDKVRIDNVHRVPEPRTGYIEFRSNCAANVKVYFQQEPMKYSASPGWEGYKIGFYYIAAEDIQETR